MNLQSRLPFITGIFFRTHHGLGLSNTTTGQITKLVAHIECAHDWNDLNVTTMPNCTQKGSGVRTCKKDVSHTESIVLATVVNNHVWGDWTVTQMPTENNEGEVKRTCQPGHTETITIPKLSSGETRTSERQTRDSRYGILLENAVVSDIAKIEVKTPENSLVNIMVSDNLGNILFETSGKSTDTFVWNLKNKAGRFVGNGSYLVVAEARGGSGKVWQYSAKQGVKK